MKVFLILIGLLIVIMFIEKKRSIESFFPALDYNKKKIHTNSIYPINKDITITDNVKSHKIDAQQIRLNNNDLFSRNPNGDLIIGNNNIDIHFPANKSVISKKPTILEAETNFKNVKFMDNVYFNNGIKKNNTPICFQNDDPSNCLYKKDLEQVIDVDLKNFKELNDMLRSACISSDSIQSSTGMSEQDINESSNILNNSPFDDSMICVNEQKGIDTLRRWYHMKDDIKTEETLPS